MISVQITKDDQDRFWVETSYTDGVRQQARNIDDALNQARRRLTEDEGQARAAMQKGFRSADDEDETDQQRTER